MHSEVNETSKTNLLNVFLYVIPLFWSRVINCIILATGIGFVRDYGRQGGGVYGRSISGSILNVCKPPKASELSPKCRFPHNDFPSDYKYYLL